MHCENLGPVHTTHVMSCSDFSEMPAEPCSEVYGPVLLFVKWHSLSHKREVVGVQVRFGTVVD